MTGVSALIRRTRAASCSSRPTTSPDPELSIVIPALNEALTITDFVAWCQRGAGTRPASAARS